MSGEVRLWLDPCDGTYKNFPVQGGGEYVALPLATHAALIERLRVAEGLLRLSRRFVDDNVMGRFVPDISSPEILTNIDTFLEGASHVAR